MLIQSSEIQAIEHRGLEKAQGVLLSKRELQSSERERIKFLEIVAEDSQEFCAIVRSWGVTRGNSPSVLPYQLSESEYLELPWSTEEVIASTWADLPVAMAAQPGAWARIHVELIEEGLISSSFLATSKKKQSGRDRINRIVNKERVSKKRSKEIESCVRDVLRRLGGIIRDRGARSTYLDCPLAKAWWRHRYATEAQRIFSIFTTQELSEVLRISARWEVLIESMVSRLTVIGDQNIRPALIIQLAESNERSKEKVRTLADVIGRHTATQALGALSPPQVKEIIKSEIVPIVSGTS